MAASSVIGALRVNLGLDSAQFQKGLRQSQTDIQRFAAQAKKTALASVAAFSAIAAGALALTTATARTAKEIERFSQVANATPEEFQKWSAAAKDVGIEQEKLSDILKDVNDRVGDFLTTGGGPMADFFENIAPRVGVTADQFKKLSGPEALQLYVDTLQKAGVSQQEMTFYLEAMASDTTALIPLLKNGGEELNRLGQNAASLGAIMSGTAVASLAAFDVSLQNVGLAMTGVRNRIAAELAPAFTALSDAFVNAMREGGALRIVIDGLIDNISLIASTAAAFTAFMVARWVGAMAIAAAGTFTLTGAVNLLRAAIVKTGFGALIIGAGILVDWFGRLVQSAGGFGNALGLLKDVALDVFDRIKIGFQIIPAAVSAGSAAMSRFFTGKLADMAQVFQDFTWAIAGGLNELFGTELRGMSAGLVGELEAAASSSALAAAGARYDLEQLASAATAPLESLKALNGIMTETETSSSGASDAINDVANSLSELDGVGGGGGGSDGGGASGTLKDAADNTDKLRDKFAELKQTMESAFVNLLNGANSLRDTIKNLLSSFADMALSQGFQMLWNGGGTSSGGGIGGFISGLFGGGTAIAGARAAGGPVGGGRTYLVGEEGPELFTPGVSGGIIPNHQMTAGGGDRHYHINAQGAQIGVADQIVAAIKQYDQSMPARVNQIQNDPWKR